MKKKLIKDEEEIIRLYTIEKISTTKIAKMLDVNQKSVSNLLKSKNIELKYIFTDEHIRKISVPNKKKSDAQKGRKASIEAIYKNMAVHLRYDVNYSWLMQFDDIEKLKFLNTTISRNRDYFFDTKLYIEYIIKFFYDEKFNLIYKKWLVNNKNKWLRPSLDHIKPKLGSTELDYIDNLEFITWFENRCKSDINVNDWNVMKNNIYFYLT
jgi:predicted transcriptional regulator